MGQLQRMAWVGAEPRMRGYFWPCRCQMLVPVLTLPVLAGLAYAFGLRFMGAPDRGGPQSLADTLVTH